VLWEHDPEKFMAGLDPAITPVFREDHASTKGESMMAPRAIMLSE
jgi:hypothetical protein